MQLPRKPAKELGKHLHQGANDTCMSRHCQVKRNVNIQHTPVNSQWFAHHNLPELQLLQQGRLHTWPPSQALEKTSNTVTSIGDVRLPRYLQGIRTRPTVVNREMLAGIPDVVHMLRDNTQGISLSIPPTHSRRLGEILTQHSLLPASRSPFTNYNIHPLASLSVQIFAPGFNHTMKIFRLNQESIRDLILDNFYVLRDSTTEKYYLIVTTSDLKTIMSE